MKNSIFNPDDPAAYDGDDRVVTSGEMRAELAKRQANRPYTTLKTGISDLDFVLNGVEGGELILVTGQTKVGKTTLLKTITHNMSERGIETLWIPFEAGGAKFMRGFGEDVRFNIPLQLKPNSLPWVLDRMSEAIARYGIKAVFIDHLHRLANMAQLENPSLQFGAIVSALVTRVEEHEIVLFLVAHMKNVNHTIPRRGDTRDSGLIECECDTMLGVYRGEKASKGSKKSKVVVLHNRRVGTTDVTIHLTLDGQYLVEDCDYREHVPAMGGT